MAGMTTAEAMARLRFRREKGLLLVGFGHDGARVVEFYAPWQLPLDLVYRFRRFTVTSNAVITREGLVAGLRADRRKEARERLG